MRPKAVQLVLKRCLGHRDGEAVLVVTDPPMEPHARDFLQHAHALGIDATLLTMPTRKSSGEEPPRAVAEAMKSSPVSVLITSRSLTHTLARREACEKHGARIASMPGADPSRLEALLDIDYDELRARSEELAALLDGAQRVRVVTPAGTDLIDGSVAGLGLLKEAITITFAAGRAVEISDPRLRDLLQPHGPDALQL